MVTQRLVTKTWLLKWEGLEAFSFVGAKALESDLFTRDAKSKPPGFSNKMTRDASVDDAKASIANA